MTIKSKIYSKTSNNPMMSEQRFHNAANAHSTAGVMTANGAINKATLLISIVFATSVLSWNMALGGLTVVAAIAALIVALVTVFKPTVAPVTAPIYAVLEGVLLGGISRFMEASYPGIAVQAVLGTIIVFFIMMVLYRSGIVKVTDRMRSTIVSAIMGVFFLYLISFILNFFLPAGSFSIFQSGWLGIGISVVVIVVAAFTLLLDFDMIERAETFNAPKYMEWYCAFSLLVTLVWLYLSILRLLSILRRD